jgi:tryptophan synthase alpha chain
MVKRVSGLPVCVGFGVKSGAQAAEMAKIADGVVVGSAFVEKAGDAHATGRFETAGPAMGKLARELRVAIDSSAKPDTAAFFGSL